MHNRSQHNDSAKVTVIGINGSPRKYGSTYKLLRIALEFAEREGAKVEVLHLYDYDIKPCIGCLSDDIKLCKYPCPIKDDFNKLAARLLDADGFIIATPIYWYAPSGAVKNFIDRLTSLENMIYHEPGRSLLEGKVAGLIAVGNDTGAIIAISWMMVVFNSMGVHIPAWALAYHHDKKIDAVENRDAILDAANLGINIVRAARILQASREWYRIIDDEILDAIVLEVDKEVRELRNKLLEERLKLARNNS